MSRVIRSGFSECADFVTGWVSWNLKLFFGSVNLSSSMVLHMYKNCISFFVHFSQYVLNCSYYIYLCWMHHLMFDECHCNKSVIPINLI